MDIELSNRKVVAVDGGTATGKGRLIEELAILLRSKGVPVVHVSTGSIYRAVAYAALEAAADMVVGRADMTPEQINHAALALVREMSADEFLKLARQRQIELHGGVVWIDGVPAEVDEQLKGPGVGTGASIAGLHLPVREWETELVRRQINEFDGFVLIDGRDIGHTVVPDAPLKLLLVVAPEVAAQRSREHTLEEIVERDERDRTREHGALRHPGDPGEGVVVLATDKHTPESLRDEVYELMCGVFADLPAA
ncbi:MAG TPA: (d)CMP kinase [Candidatus Saccharimonadia bacterium]|nr:(d)CMP kinase [Candidatus Saccharimonadia bacterium]